MRPILILSFILNILSALQPTDAAYGYNQYHGTMHLTPKSSRAELPNYDMVPAVNYEVMNNQSPPAFYPQPQSYTVPIQSPQSFYNLIPGQNPTSPQIPSQAYYVRLCELADLICRTFTDMGGIASADNSEIGRRIVTTLSGEYVKVNQIMIEYLNTLNSNGGRRRKRENASDPLNRMGNVLVDSNAKIGDDKKQLSGRAKRDINDKYKDGVKNCAADSCKAAARILSSVEDGESERQRRR